MIDEIHFTKEHAEVLYMGRTNSKIKTGIKEHVTGIEYDKKTTAIPRFYHKLIVK